MFDQLVVSGAIRRRRISPGPWRVGHRSDRDRGRDDFDSADLYGGLPKGMLNTFLVAPAPPPPPPPPQRR